MPEALANAAYMWTPEGELHAVPKSQVRNALLNGYQQASPEEVSQHVADKKYGGIGQGLLSAAEGAGEAIAPGVAPYLETSSSLTTPEAIKGRAEAHPVLHGVGTAAGYASPFIAALLGQPELLAGAPGLIAKAGTAVTKAASPTLGKLGAYAAAGSAEAGLVEAGQLANEKVLGEPDLTGQKIAARLGLAFGLGAPLGAVLGPIGEKFGTKAAIKLGSEVEEPAEAAGQELVPTQEEVPIAAEKPQTLEEAVESLPIEEEKKAGALEGLTKLKPQEAVESLPIEEEKKAGALEGLTKLKPHADEIKAAADEIGAPVLESQITASTHLQDVDQMLIKSPTPVGVMRRQKLEEGIAAAGRAVSKALESQEEGSAAEVGAKLGEGLTEDLEAQRKPISELYEELEGEHEVIPLERKSLDRIATNIRDIEHVGIWEGSPEHAFAQSVATNLEKNVKSVGQLKEFISMVSRRGVNPELRHIVGVIREKLKRFEDNSVLRFAEKHAQKGSPFEKRIKALLETRKTADAKYRELMESMGELGKVMGKKKIRGPQDFLDFVHELTPEALTQKLFTKNNSRFLKFFQEKFPERAKVLRDYQRKLIAEGATHDGAIQPNKALREISKLSKEAQEFLFSKEELKKINAARTYMESMPKNLNPSDTSKMEAYRRYFEHPLTHTLGTIHDLAALAAVKRATGTSRGIVLRRVIRVAQSTTNSIKAASLAIVGSSEALSSIRQAGLGLLGESESQKADEKRAKDIEDTLVRAHADPKHLIDSVSEATQLLSSHAPMVSSSVSQTMARAISFLQSKLPTQDKGAPLSNAPVQSSAELARFSKYVRAVDSPLTILGDALKGELAPEGVETVQAVYPELYSNMQKHLFDALSESMEQKKKIPYKSRLMLSMLLGTDLDGTLAQTIQNQAQFQVRPRPTQGMPPKKKRAAASKIDVANLTQTPQEARARGRLKQ